MIEDVDYTASGYIQAIAPDGTVISRHRQEREAQQACFQHAKDNEDLLGDGVHDYILRSPDVRMSIRLLSVGGNPTNEDTTPPDPPAGVFNNGVTSTGFTTNWTNGSESDLQEHNVYRSSTGPSSGFSLVDTVTVPTASYSHSGLTAETQYWVYVTALDSSGNESVASSVVTATTDAASTEPYDLSGFSIPFAYSWPTAPTTTSTVNVTTANQSVLASPTSGTLYNVAAGTYTVSPNFNAYTDIDVVCDDAAVFTNQVTIGSRVNTNVARIRWTGGVWQDRCVVERATDVLFNNVNSSYDGGGAGDYYNQWGGEHNTDPRLQRLAAINCTFQANNVSGTGGWCVAMLPSTTVFSDIIFANCVMNSVGQTCRLQNHSGLIIVDSYFNMALTGGNGLRIQFECDDVFMEDCHVADSFQMNNSTTYACRTGTFNNVSRYEDATGNPGAFASTSGNGSANSGTVTGCQMYSSAGNDGNALSVGDFTNGGNPLIAAWDGVTTPSTAAAGADH